MSKQKFQSKFGCFFTGCLGAAAALVVVVAVVLIGGYYFVEKYLDDYTAKQPIKFKAPTLTAEEDTDLKEKWSTFKTQSNLELPTEPLELDSDQLNHLINTESGFSPLKNKVALEIVQNKVTAQISIPATLVKEVFPNIPNIGLIENRFFNAQATLNLWLENDQLAVYLDNLRMEGGKQIDRQYLDRLKGVDLLKDQRFAGQVKRQFGNLREVTVKDGKIVMIGSKGTLEEMLNNR